MINVHNPERANGESFEAYKERRAYSQRLVRYATRGGDASRVFANPERAAERRLKAQAIIERMKQRGQKVRKRRQKHHAVLSMVGRNPRRQWRYGEPLIVVKPVRAARLARMSEEERMKKGLQPRGTFASN